jgi:hypothetical protein
MSTRPRKEKHLQQVDSNKVSIIVRIEGDWSPHDPETLERINRLTMFREMVEQTGTKSGDGLLITATKVPASSMPKPKKRRRASHRESERAYSEIPADAGVSEK